MDNFVGYYASPNITTDTWQVTTIGGSGSNEKVWDLGEAKSCVMTCAARLNDSSNEYIRFYYSDDNSTFTQISASGEVAGNGMMFSYLNTTAKHRYWKVYRKHYGSASYVYGTINYL